MSIANRLRLRHEGAAAGRTTAHVATVSGVWPAANWLEREVWDLFGIAFDGHPDPRRLLMPEDWEGFPLRKDYPVQIRMTPHATRGRCRSTEEEFRANVMKDRLTRGDERAAARLRDWTQDLGPSCPSCRIRVERGASDA